MRLTPRDVRILEHILRMRFLDRRQIQLLEFDRTTSASNAKRRLTLLYHHGLIGRRLLPPERGLGSPLALYHLERAGLRELRRGSMLSPGVDLVGSRSDGEPYFLRHLMETNDVWIAALRSARRHRLEFAWHDERELRRTLTGVRQARDRMMAPIPDGYAMTSIGGARLSFALELDRGTTEERRVRKKLISYELFHDVHAAELQRPRAQSSLATAAHLFAAGVRVLFVASGSDTRAERERAQDLLRWCEEEHGGSLFWFTTLTAVCEGDFFTAPIWTVAGRRGTSTLVDGAAVAPPPRLADAPRLL